MKSSYDNNKGYIDLKLMKRSNRAWHVSEMFYHTFLYTLIFAVNAAFFKVDVWDQTIKFILIDYLLALSICTANRILLNDLFIDYFRSGRIGLIPSDNGGFKWNKPKTWFDLHDAWINYLELKLGINQYYYRVGVFLLNLIFVIAIGKN